MVRNFLSSLKPIRSITFVLLCLVPALSWAQLDMLPSPASLQPPHAREIGAFTIGGEIGLAVAPTSNIRLDSTEESDVARFLFASGSAASNGKKLSLTTALDVLVQDVVDPAHDAQDNEAVTASISSRYQLNKEVVLNAALQRQQSIIGKDHVDQLNGFVHGLSTTKVVQLGSDWVSDNWTFGASGQYSDIATVNDVEYTNQVMRQSLDRQEFETTLEAQHAFSKGQVYAFMGTQSIRYEASENLGMTDRNSDGWRLGSGFELKQGRWQYALNAIAFGQNFATASIKDVRSVVGSLEVRYQPGNQFAAIGLVDRGFFETNIEGSAGIFTTTYFVGVMFSPTESSAIKAGPSFSRSRLAGSNSATEQTAIDIEYEWRFSSRASLFLSTSIARQTVNDPMLLDQQYDVELGSLSISFYY